MTPAVAGLRRLLVTRPQPQADAWVSALRECGLPARALPLLEIGPAPDAEAVRAAAAEWPGFDFVMFVSPNAVLQWRACLAADWSWPAGLRAGCTGPGTQAALRQAGVPDGCIVAPDPAGPLESEALWQRIAAEDWHGRRVCIVRGDGGRDWLSRTFAEAGAQVTFLQAYARRPPHWTAEQEAEAVQALADPEHSCWLLSSSEAVDHLAERLPQLPWPRLWALASHPRIEARARAHGALRVGPCGAGVDGVVQALRTP